MIWILFFLLAFLTVYLSTKLSFYADKMSKTTKINKALIGGLLIAGITSLPELVTCYSAISLDNIYLAVGDVLGSNLFNISIMCFLDLIFLKKLFFNHTSKNYYFIYLILLFNYLVMYLAFKEIISFSIINIGLPTFLIAVTYLIYFKTITKLDEKSITIKEKSKENILSKFILTAIAMIVISILLTFVVNLIASLNPHLSSSVLGAVLLGITTSLPEVITFIALMRLNSYDLALSEIIGSNLFNIFVLAIGDIILRNNPIYYYADVEILNLLKLCFLTTIINLYQNQRNKSYNKFTYLLPSLLIVFAYILFIIV